MIYYNHIQYTVQYMVVCYMLHTSTSINTVSRQYQCMYVCNVSMYYLLYHLHKKEFVLLRLRLCLSLSLSISPYPHPSGVPFFAELFNLYYIDSDSAILICLHVG